MVGPRQLRNCYVVRYRYEADCKFDHAVGRRRLCKIHVKICLVGVASAIQEFAAKQNNRTTILNRLTEVEEVSRLAYNEALEIMTKGFEDRLKLKFSDPRVGEDCLDIITNVSDRIAAEVQDLCLRVAPLAFKNEKTIEILVVEDAVHDWIVSSHSAAAITIRERMNTINPQTGRRTQCIFAIGCLENQDFSVHDVESTMRSLFPESTGRKSLGVKKLVRELSEGRNPPIRKVPNSKLYRFSHPKYRMAIRALLKRRADETVWLKRQEA